MNYQKNGHVYSLDWWPVPKRPWIIRNPEKRVVQAFYDLGTALDWLTKAGYEFVAP